MSAAGGASMPRSERDVLVEVSISPAVVRMGGRSHKGGPQRGRIRFMRSITVTMSVTLDGVVQGPGRPDEDIRGGFTHGGWGQRYTDDVMGREMAKGMAKPGDMLFGRRTWQTSSPRGHA
jgi:hypothetical protein